MTRILIIIIFLLVAIVIFSCKSKENLSPDAVQSMAAKVNTEKSITFGNGGGFTGREQAYTLKESGHLYNKGSAPGNYKIDDNLCKQIFSNYETLGFNKMALDSPGNMYYFVSMQDGTRNHKLTWGAHDANEPKELLIFYNSLFGLTQKMKRAVKSEKMMNK